MVVVMVNGQFVWQEGELGVSADVNDLVNGETEYISHMQ